MTEPVTNVVSGTVSGNAVLAGTVEGGVHFGGDQYFDLPPYVVGAFAPAGRPADDRLRAVPPSEWLAARNAVIDFVGRAGELAELAEWLDGPAARAVHVVHALGGYGKTRLVSRFAEQCGANVVTAQYGRGRRRAAEPVPADGQLLVLVDYADRWPRSALERLLCEELPVEGVRVLLLARTVGPWWAGLRQSLADEGYTLSVKELGPDDLEQRRLLFQDAVRRFARIRELQGSDDLEPVGSLENPVYESALTVLMAALVRVDAAARGAEPPADPGELSAYLRDREYAHWAKLADAGHVKITPQTMARVVTVATLAGESDYTEALSLLQSLGLADSVPSATDLIDAHSACYPPDSATKLVLRPMQPDRLGEDFVAAQLIGDVAASHLARTLLLDEQEDRRQAVWTTMAEIAKRWPRVRDGHVIPMLTEHPDLSSRIGAGPVIAVAGYAPIDLLTRMAEHFPAGRHIELDPAIATVVDRVIGHQLQQTDDPISKADLHLKLSIRLADAGEAHDALSHAEQAVDLFREAGPRAFPHLGVALNNLGFRLSDLHRGEQALQATEQAVEIARLIAETVPETFTTPYAVTLSNLAYDLNRAKRHAEASAAAHQAAEILAKNPEAPDQLALALWNEGIARRGLNEPEAAIALLRRSTGIFAELTAAEPTAHLPELVRVRTDLARMLSRSGQHAQAWPEADEAVRGARALLAANAAAHGVTFLRAVDLAGRIRFKLDDFEGALLLQREALDLRRAGFAESDGSHDTEGPQTLSDTLLALGRTQEALRIAREAVAIRRRDTRRDPDGHQLQLASALTHLSYLLTFVGAHDEALSASAEAVESLRRLYDARTGEGWSSYANGLVNQAIDLNALDRAGEADELFSTARELYERFGQTHPPDQWLAGFLHSLATHVLMKDGDRALSLLDDSIAIRRGLDDTGPATCASLLMRAVALSRMERHDEALASSSDSVSGFRRLAGQALPAYGKRLLRALRVHADVLKAAGQVGEEAALTEAVEVSHRYAALPAKVRDHEATLEYFELAAALHQRGRTGDAARLDSLVIAACPATAEANQGGQRGVAEHALNRGYNALLEKRYDEAIELLRIGNQHHARLGDLEGLILGLENTYLVQRAQRRYVAASAVLVWLVQPLVLGRYDDRLLAYQEEIRAALSTLDSQPDPAIGERDDVLEVLANLSPQQRQAFVQAFDDEVGRWRAHIGM
ncbi:tetratricopeptide (TPR) repeat protein [Kibdelosporangium banguiense]|uniref:Tetratricopeptide (TPR) repeat protein n=1 Tax=Kibdelosporangium banguiense TaxID=1365924 RepID=A0ABS4TPA6_9PSEU|nr:tetratricopeptide repeat protein [Kibdelosporangium banguiense]MBP2326239.1 tetratricopeptide (TPR) repeat protein [Kibdelosporangium banguiense]